MLSALGEPQGARGQSLAGRSAALGVSHRWPGQEVDEVAGVRIAIDADLLNVSELKRTLAGKGIDASGLSLAELLAHLYVLYGTAFVEHLHGAFSLALWDETNQRLVLAVDRLGIKALEWRREGDRLLFASRTGAVRAAQERPAEIDPGALVQYLLFSTVPAPMSIYRGSAKLRPGFLLIYEAGCIAEKKYWDLEYPESVIHDERYWARELREAVRASVHLHLEGCSLQTTGAYLSGGTDSSSVVAFMNEMHSPVNTFSVIFQESRFSEAEFARTTAVHFRTRHHERSLTPEDACAAIPKLVRYYDEPFANSSAIGAYYCAQLAREIGVEVLLAGDGGDELFGGNERYAKDKYFALYHVLPRWLRSNFLEPAVALLPANGGVLSLPRRYVRRARIPNPDRLASFGFFMGIRPDEAFDPALLAEAPPETWLTIPRAHFHAARASTELNRLLYLDVKMALADNDLRKVAGTAEIAGVRVRFPLLDHPLAEFSGRIPTHLKLRRFEKRYIFKKAMERILPQKVLYKKKHGFGVPMAFWLLRHPRLQRLTEDVLLDSRTRQRGYFAPGFIEKLFKLCRTEHAGYYGEIVWYLLTLELWHREHFEHRAATFAT
jgi:asparagine synthase (glutamine-hydrolysing)